MHRRHLLTGLMAMAVSSCAGAGAPAFATRPDTSYEALSAVMRGWKTNFQTSIKPETGSRITVAQARMQFEATLRERGLRLPVMFENQTVLISLDERIDPNTGFRILELEWSNATTDGGIPKFLTLAWERVA